MSGHLAVREQLGVHLKQLRLPVMRRCYEESARRAEKETLSYEQYLLELAEREQEGRLLPVPGLPLRAPSMEESSSLDWARQWSSRLSCMTTIETQDPLALSNCPRAVVLGSKYAERKPL